MSPYKKIPAIVYTLMTVISLQANAQITSSQLTGRVINTRGESLAGVGIRIHYLPDQSSYADITRQKGLFNIENLPAGGPYEIELTCIGYDTLRVKDIYLNLGSSSFPDWILPDQTNQLSAVTVRSFNKTKQTGILSGHRSVLDERLLTTLPAPGLQLSDYLRAVPNTRLRKGEEGAVGFGGQNNRYNSFYVDGAIQNDVFGLSGSGTNGGQAGISPVSLESLEQIQVTLSPYDVSTGNFTGAAIQAVTKSGGNQWKGSLYHYLSTGKGSDNSTSENPDNPGRQFVNSRKGFQVQGALRPNKLFYYLNAELERNAHTTKFSASQYSGYSRDPGLLSILSNTLKDTYQYDPGSLWDKTATVNADRLAIRIDWNAGAKSKYTFSYRYTLGDRNDIPENDSRQLHFSNDGYHLLSKTNTYTAEWKTSRLFKGANRLLLTYTHITDDRSPTGKPFPGVRINDGGGVIQFGTDINSGINDLAQKNLTLYDKFSFWWGKQLIHFGVDGEYNQVQNAFIQNSFGNYSFSSLSNFLTQSHPSNYQLGIGITDNPNTEETNQSAQFSKIKISFFLGDQFSPSAHLRLQMGIRMDYHRLLNSPAENSFVNDSLLPILNQYYALENIHSGAGTNIPISLSPRLGLLFSIPAKGILLEGGLGMFAGRIPLVWPGGSYLHDGLRVGGYTASPAALQQMRFRPDPYQQWKPAETGSVMNKIPLDLLQPTLALPKRFTGNFHTEKKWLRGWKAEMDISFSKMLRELQYTQINLLPPADTVAGPDNRLLYTTHNGGLIPVRPDSSNPFGYVMLIGNQGGKKGYAQTFSAAIAKMHTNGWQWECQYSWGKSRGYQDGGSSINSSQWRFVESVNGRNQLVLSESDYSPGHRIFILLSKEIRNRLQRSAFSISLSYTGSSGNGFSYVYGGQSMTRDDGLFGAYDLIYIPDPSSLEKMIFLPLYESGETYSPEEQKKAFGQYLEKTPYLQKRRGQYAERNGSRTPFTHRADLSLQKKIQIGTGNHRVYGRLMLDIYNLLNLINSNWGWVYEVPFDAYPLLDFAGYTGNGVFIPQYRFHPKTGNETPWKIAGSYHPLYSSFWTIRLGIKISL